MNPPIKASSEQALAAVSLKELTEDSAIIAGYGVLWGARDLTGEYFSPDTDFQLDYVPVKAVFYDHSLRDEPELEDPIGRVLKIAPDDHGLWVESELLRSHAYTDRVLKLVEKGVLGYSSAAISHLVRKEQKADGVFIKRWTIAEISLTTTPAEPRTVGVERIKHAGGAEPEFTAPDTPPQASAEEPAAQPVQPDVKAASGSGVPVSISITEYDDMSNAEERLTALETEMKALPDLFTEEVKKILQHIDDAPALKHSGYVSQDGGTADADRKSFGDFLKAVQRGDDKRLTEVYQSRKALNEGAGEAGGYLVPVTYSTEVLKVAMEQSRILPLIPRQTVSTPTGKYPALDNYVVPTAGSGETAGGAGVKSAKRAEGGAYAETEAKFAEIEWKVNDAISGYTKVTKELRTDSPASIEQLLRNLFAIVDGAKQEYYFLMGSGVGEPLGILHANNPARVAVTPAVNNVFGFVDALAMKARFKAVGTGRTRWVRHLSMLPDFGALQVAANSPAVLQTNLSGDIVDVLLGTIIVESEHVAQADASGCVSLIDFAGYMAFDLGGAYVDFSEHADFLNGRDVWRFGRRLDGQPWLKNVITLASPGAAYTVSPFVIFND